MIDMDQAQILAQLKGIIDQIAAAELLRESLPLSQWETLVASLQAQMHDLQIQLEGDGTIVVGSGNKVIGAGAIYIEHLTVQYSERLWSQLAAAHTPLPDLKKATAEYLTTLINKYRYLDFRGLGVIDRLPTQLSLLQMMVPLKARRLLPDGETWPRDETIDEEYDAVPVVDLLQAQDGLIVLGDPGSGKTTFLKYLMLMLATGDGDKIGLADRLPLAIPLSAYANALAEKDVPLDQFIETYHRGMGIDLPLDSMVREALNNGRALLLLDGLDEVIDERQRLLLIDHVLSFYALQRQRGNRFVMTSRLVGYGSTRPVADGLAECMLTDFDNDAIKAFVKRWSLVLAQAAQGDSAQAIVEANETAVNLTTAILHNPGIKQLATNPLLLTILVLMQRQGIVLPARRVELYEQYIA
ncbi:MAG: NACHT domain-containing protein, partial [Chloroflexi bacterium]|nr:NACHT domain-containing protein [Chloroflexota bacterium]